MFLRRRLDTAFMREEGWAELLEQAVGVPRTTAGLGGIRNEVGLQVAGRWLLPAQHSTAALDTALGRVRDFLDSRSFVLRNATLTNVLLGLIRNHLNGDDLDSSYRTHLRDIADEQDNRPSRHPTSYDPRYPQSAIPAHSGSETPATGP